MLSISMISVNESRFLSLDDYIHFKLYIDFNISLWLMVKPLQVFVHGLTKGKRENVCGKDENINGVLHTDLVASVECNNALHVYK